MKDESTIPRKLSQAANKQLFLPFVHEQAFTIDKLSLLFMFQRIQSQAHAPVLVNRLYIRLEGEVIIQVLLYHMLDILVYRL